SRRPPHQADLTRASIHASTLSRLLNSMLLITAAAGKSKPKTRLKRQIVILLTPRYFASSLLRTQRRFSCPQGSIAPPFFGSFFFFGGLVVIEGLPDPSGESLGC